MDVTVRLFASLRQHAGAGTVPLTLDEGATVADAIAQLRDGALSGLPENAPFVAAVARKYVGDDHPLTNGDELALVPPVSGGAGEVRLAAVTREPLDTEALRRLVADPSSGATVVFLGTTREVPTLEYEAYEDMAREQIKRLAEAVVQQHGLAAVAVAHRIGTVELMEPSIVIAVSAGHRAEAFEGARALLDAIKAQAPIWKQEHPEDGPPQWVAGLLPRIDGS
jgi:molybdopterin synthase catalytic subunit/molybdopterin converting factor small subunit